MTPIARVRALATDYDRTLTDPDLRLEDATVTALKDARAAGLRVIVISGRDLAYLAGKLDGAADAFVAENGCFVAVPESTPNPGRGEPWRLREDGPPYRRFPVFKEPFRVRDVLDGAGVDVEWGEALCSVADVDEARARALLDGHAVDFIRNRDRVMLLPRGVDKAVGLEAALRVLGLRLGEVAAAGDGENDLVMMEAAGHAVAVANALPDVKAVADHVTRAPGGAGLIEWLSAWRRANHGALPRNP